MNIEYPELASHLERKKMQTMSEYYLRLALRAQRRGNRIGFDHYYQYAEYYLKRANGHNDASPPAVSFPLDTSARKVVNNPLFAKEPPKADNQRLPLYPRDPQGHRYNTDNTLH